MQPATTQKLMGAMLGVVDEGTGARAKQIVDGTGWDLGGKTGTADVRPGQRPDAWFAGLMIGPDARPKYTVVVYVENGGQGGQRAAPIAGAMTRFMAGWTKERAAAATPPRTALREGGR
ncbi:MAG TPA: penicillin-binding transpeptidase domain-containing protein [Longimicrobium sp.]|nr:penicillin-binding transpeptidase domain-containing protein [Longimicrobium sp.]